MSSCGTVRVAQFASGLLMWVLIATGEITALADWMLARLIHQKCPEGLAGVA